MDSGHGYSRLPETSNADLQKPSNGEMPRSEVETSYINCVGANATSHSEPAILVDNQRLNFGKQSSTVEASSSPKKEHVRQSRKLPYWLWYIIAKALGLKLSPHEKPICAIILYLFTLLSALGYVIASIWYSVFDVLANHKGRSAQLQGTVTILMTSLWCALGVYANKLAYRLFGHRKFLDMLRLHSKTVFKLNAALVVFFLWTAFIVLLNLGTMKFWIGTPCFKVNLDRVVCQVRYMCQVVFSIFALLWNILVAVVLVSVCRTHTISIRRFILDLEQDAIACDTRGETAKDVALDHEFEGDDYFDDLTEDSEGEEKTNIRRNQVQDSTNTLSTVVADSPGSSVRGRGDSVNPATSNALITLSNAEILHRYWSLMVKLRISSLALQRWMVSVMALTVVWAALNLVHWLSHDPQLYDVLNFLIPLLLLPLLCSAYSEVNNEGLRIPKCIKPLQNRLEMLMYLDMYPLHMTVFNYAITYQTIGTVAAGFLLALISKMLMEDITFQSS